MEDYIETGIPIDADITGELLINIFIPNTPLHDGAVTVSYTHLDVYKRQLQIIKTKKGMSRVSGAMIMERGDEKYIFADCAINIDPDSETLAEIAYQSSKTAEMIGLDPKIDVYKRQQ